VADELPWTQCKRNDRSEQVRTLQYLLRARGYHVAADGIFGATTENAVRRFQRLRHLVADGTVGAQTWQAIIVTLKPGSKGDAVRALQNLLRAQSYKVGIDGRFGRQTEWAVRSLQRDYEIRPDAVVGRATWNRLLGEQESD
jgi:peptidoglycan hydrolase-like protein with peptidoglycan-binding domain